MKRHPKRLPNRGRPPTRALLPRASRPPQSPYDNSDQDETRGCSHGTSVHTQARVPDAQTPVPFGPPRWEYRDHADRHRSSGSTPDECRQAYSSRPTTPASASTPPRRGARAPPRSSCHPGPLLPCFALPVQTLAAIATSLIPSSRVCSALSCLSTSAPRVPLLVAGDVPLHRRRPRVWTLRLSRDAEIAASPLR